MTESFETDDGVGVIRFGDPASRSRWTPEYETTYFDRLADYDRHPDVRVIVVAGAADGDFCAGPDLDALTENGSRDPRGDQFPRSVSKPIIAAIDGACHGIGLSLALTCDLRVVSASTRISAGFASFGLVAEHGVHWLLQRICGEGVAADLLMTDRRIDGAEAWRLGVAQYLAEGSTAIDFAMELARGIARTLSPLSLAVIKRQLASDAGGTLDTAVTRGEELVRRVARHGDFHEAVEAFTRRELPQFGPLDHRTLGDVWGTSAGPDRDLPPSCL